MPVIGDGSIEDLGYRAKHTETFLGHGLSQKHFGTERWCLCTFHPELSGANHTALVADPQVFALPENINQQIGGQLANVTSKLNAVNIPWRWIQATTTYKQLIRRLVQFFDMMEKAATLAEDQVTKMFEGGRTLETTIGSLAPALRNRLTNVATRWNLDTTGLNGSSTIEEVLVHLTQQRPMSPWQQVVIDGN